MTNFVVCDSIMGNGKTSAMQHLLKQAGYDEGRYIIVVPLLTEVERWRTVFENCAYNPVAPECGQKHKTKSSDLKELLSHKAKMIIITHAMFERFGSEMVDLIKEGEYSLVLDEVPIPIHRIEMPKGDTAIYIKAGVLIVDQETNRVAWNKEFMDIDSKYVDVRELCVSRNVIYNKTTQAIYVVSPYEIYFAFKTVYILTYMFEAQIIYYYLMQQNVSYKKYSVCYEKELDCYVFVDYNNCFNKMHDWKPLIKICRNKRMNAIGEKSTSLSLNWFAKNPSQLKTLKNNVFNFTRNVCKAKAGDILWTTYSDYRDALASNGFKKGFLAVNAKATNDFSDRTVVSYVANRFVSPDIKNYFYSQDENIRFDVDAYALSEMLQFIWRSAIRVGKPINIYVPSARMRGLLEKWIEENSVQEA